MEFTTVEELRRTAPRKYTGVRVHSVKLFIRGDDESSRREGCLVVKEVIEDILGQEQAQDKIKAYSIEMLDLTQTCINLHSFDPFWRRLGNIDGVVTIPIFHNADNYAYLPQISFDQGLPAVFSLTREGYLHVNNPSKRDCYDV